MAKASPIQSAFNGGEWSPLMEGRVSLEPYKTAVRKSINYTPLAQGPLIRRSGTRFAAPQFDHQNKSKMVEFEFSAVDAFMLGFENQRTRVLTRPGGALLRPAFGVAVLVSLSPLVFSVEPGHGFLVGDEVFFGSFDVSSVFYQAFGQVSVVAGNDITITGILVPPSFALSGGETLAGVFHIATPYLTAHLPSLRSVQSADTVYLFNGQVSTQVLRRNSIFDWPIRDFAFEDGPYLSINDTTTTLAPTTTGTAITSFNPANAFSSGDTAGNEDDKAFDGNVNGGWAADTNQTASVGYDFGSATQIRGYTIYGRHASLVNEHSKDDYYPASWTFQGGNDGVNWTVLDTQLDFVLYKGTRSPFFKLKTLPNFSRYRIVISGLRGGGAIPPVIHELLLTPALGSSAGQITLNASSTTGINRGLGFAAGDVGRPLRLRASDKFWRWYTISQVTSPTQIVARQESDVLPDLQPIVDWRLGAFSNTTGWPTCGYFYEDRLILSGGAQNPDLVGASVPGAYERFSPTDPDGVVSDANGWTVVLNGRKVGAVRWIQSDARGLVIGTLNGPFIIRPIDGKGSLTPANAHARPISGRTCADIEPVQIDSQILSVPVSRRIVREVAYDYNKDGYKAPSMSLFSSHIGVSKFVRMVYAQDPHSIIWIPREDGVLAGFTYNREEDVLGWHRHFIGGSGIVEDAAVLPSADGSVSELWLTVKRTIGGQTRRYYEVQQPFWDEASTLDTAWFVDCGFIYEGEPTTVVTGLWKIEGATVSILADGRKVSPQVVINGKITLPFAASRIVVGFGFDSDGETLRPEAGAADGTSQGKTKRTHKMTVRLWATVGGQIGPPGGLQDIETGLPTDEPGSRPELFTGDHLVDWPDGYETENTVVLKQPGSNPLPFNVVALMPQLVTQDAR